MALRHEAFSVLSAALVSMLSQRATNAGASARQANDAIAVSMAKWRTTSEEHAIRLCTGATSHGARSELWRGGSEWAPLRSVVEGADGARGPVLDVLAVKVGVLRASVDVLEQVLLPDAVLDNSSK
jgi:hypothetical protein